MGVGAAGTASDSVWRGGWRGGGGVMEGAGLMERRRCWGSEAEEGEEGAVQERDVEVELGVAVVCVRVADARRLPEWCVG